MGIRAAHAWMFCEHSPMRAALVCLTAAVCMAIAGCSGPGARSADPSASSTQVSATAATGTSPGPAASTAPAPVVTTPAVPADVRTTGPNLTHPGERPPVMPLLATEHTAAGAIAFATFFIRTIDWGYASTSAAYMKHYALTSCIGCESIELGIDHEDQKNRHFVGDRFHDLTAQLVPNLRPGAQRTVDVTFEVDSVETVDSHNQYVGAAAALPRLVETVSLVWRTGSWSVLEMIRQ